MNIKKLNLNIIDMAVIIAILLLFATFAATQIYKPEEIKSKLKVTVRINDGEQSDIIFDQAQKDKTVYLNSINKSVEVLSVIKEQSPTEPVIYMKIVLLGPGVTEDDGTYRFNNQRLLINQKAEIRGNYFAQGIIEKIENAN